MTRIKILYNHNNNSYFNDDFPSKFENEEVERKSLDINSAKNNPDAHIKPLDIIKHLKKRPHRRGRINYIVHACIYLGNKKICHAYYDRGNDGGIVKVDDWDNFFNFVREGTDEKIIRYRPTDIFKNPEIVVKHIAKCIEGRYFDEFGEFLIEEKTDKKANNCECFANRCVLSLSFSELADYRKKKSERVFEQLGTELETNKNRLDNLTTGEVDNRVSEITSYGNQIEAQIELNPN